MTGKKRYEFAALMCKRLETDIHFLDKTMFNDEAVFHISGKLTEATAEFGAPKCQLNIFSMNVTV
jgi:hypothetical protein